MEIAPVRSRRDLDEFIELPYRLFSRSSLWVPPLRAREAALVSPGQHPFWETARRELFLAREDGKVIGRIAAICDDKYNAYSGERCGAFGFFECRDNKVAAHALLDTASKWLADQGLKFMRGPLNPSANYSCGTLVDGFDKAPALMMPWNPPYYPALIETWPMRREQDLFAYVIDRVQMNLTGWLKTEVSRIKNEKRFSCRSSGKATLANDIRAMLDIYQMAWARNWGFSPLSEAEAEEHVKELKGILDPDFFVLFFEGDKPVAGMVALPDITPLLRRLRGRMGITAPWHYLRSRKDMRKGLRIMLYGILPEYRLHGLPLLLLDYMLEKARQHPGLRWVEGSWILESNTAMDELMEDFSATLAKRYRIYRRELASAGRS